MSAAPAPTPADQVVQIVQDLHDLIDSRMRAHPVFVGIFIYIFTGLDRMRSRLVRLAAHLRAGTLPPLRPRKPRPVVYGTGPKPPRSPVLWPRKASFLSDMLGCDGPPYAERLRALLADPEAVELIVATPRIGRTLRPLCRALGVALIPELRLPRRPRKPRPKPAVPTPAQPSSDPPPVMMDFTPTVIEPPMHARIAATAQRLQERERSRLTWRPV